MSGSYPEGLFESESRYSLLLEKFTKRKKVIYILKISKREMEYLVSKGVPFSENGITHTTARHRRTYYLTESRNNSKLINDFRKSIVK